MPSVSRIIMLRGLDTSLCHCPSCGPHLMRFRLQRPPFLARRTGEVNEGRRNQRRRLLRLAPCARPLRRALLLGVRSAQTMRESRTCLNRWASPRRNRATTKNRGYIWGYFQVRNSRIRPQQRNSGKHCVDAGSTKHETQPSPVGFFLCLDDSSRADVARPPSVHRRAIQRHASQPRRMKRFHANRHAEVRVQPLRLIRRSKHARHP